MTIIEHHIALTTRTFKPLAKITKGNKSELWNVDILGLLDRLWEGTKSMTHCRREVLEWEIEAIGSSKLGRKHISHSQN